MSTGAVIYARVSTLKEEQDASVPNQLETCRRYCAQRGWEVQGEFTDRKSGKDFNRPGWLEMIAALPVLCPRHIVVTARDRIARNHVEAARLRLEVLPALDVSIVPVMGIADSDDPGLDLAICMDEVFAAHLRKMIAWKTAQGMRRNAERGLWMTKIPYGARRVEGCKGLPEPEPDTWPWLEQMFAWAADGEGTSAITRRLIDAGAPPPGSCWGTSTVDRILRSPFYIGEIRYKGEAFHAAHMCRVDLRTWGLAQQPRRPGKGGPVGSYVYLLPAVVTDTLRITKPGRMAGRDCPLYGHYTIGRGGKPYHYYYRADRLSVLGGVEVEPVAGCGDPPPVGVPAADLEAAVVRELIKLADESGEEWLFSQYMGEAGKRLAALEGEASRLRAAQSKAATSEQKFLDLLGDAFAEAERRPEVLDAVRQKVTRARGVQDHADARLLEIDSEVRQLAEAERRGALRGAQINRIAALWRDAGAGRDGAREALRDMIAVLVDRVIVRAEDALLALRPCFTVRQPGRKPALTGIEPVFPP